MSEIIETLNHTSGLRTVFYGIVFLIALELVVNGISDAIRSISHLIRSIKKPKE